MGLLGLKTNNKGKEICFQEAILLKDKWAHYYKIILIERSVYLKYETL